MESNIFINNLCDRLAQAFNRPFSFLKRLDDLYVMEKFKAVSRHINNPKDPFNSLDVYPILYKDIESLFFIPYFYIDTLQRGIVLTDKFYEFDLLVKFADLVNPHGEKNKVYMDIGANIGNHSIFFNAYGGASLIYCFEPQKIVFNILSKNISINNINAKLFNVPVSNQVVSFNIQGNFTGNLGGTRFVAGKEDNQYTSVIIDNINNIDQVDAIKIDVEGHEMAVLLGAARILSQFHPFLWIELLDDPNECKSFLKTFGYEEVFHANHNYFFK